MNNRFIPFIVRYLTIIFCIALLPLSVQAESHLHNEVIFTMGDNISMSGAIQKHADAMKAVDPFIPYISIKRWVVANFHFSKLKGPRDHFLQYCLSKKELNNKSFLNACGDGFVIGSLAAVINKLFFSKKLNKRVLGGALLSSMAMVFYQNHAMGKIPYYSDDVKLRDNYFEHLSINSGVRCLLAMICAGCSFLGTQYMLDTTTEQCEALLKSKEKQKDPFNQLL